MKTDVVERSGGRRLYRALLVCAMLLLGLAIVRHFRHAAQGNPGVSSASIPLRTGLTPGQHVTVGSQPTNVAQALLIYSDLTGRTLLTRTNRFSERLDAWTGGRLSSWGFVRRPIPPDSGITFHADGLYTAAEIKKSVEQLFRTNGLAVIADGQRHLRIIPARQ
jgi:hypothetical protein